MKRLLYLLALLPLVAQAQTQLSGRVLDAQTQQPVPYASLTVPGTTQGTTANAEGEFALTVRQLPAKVLAFSLSYGRDSVTVAQPGGPALTLRLAPAPIQLPGAEPASYAAELIIRAYRVLQHTNARQLYGQALYRQISTLDQRPTQVLEMFWQARANSAGLNGTKLDQGRFAEKKDNLISITSLSAYSRGIVLYRTQTDTTKFGNVISASPTAYYTLRLLGISQGGGQQLAEVEFTGKPEPNSAHTQGILTIDTDTYQILRYRVGVDIGMHSNNPTFKFRDSRLSCDFVFAPRPGGTIPDHYTVTLTETIGRLLKPDVHMQVVGNTYFHAWQPTAPALAYEPASSKVKDLDLIKQLPYDPTFWRDNPVVKRTPQEEAAIQSFEQEKAFGTMLNK